LVGCTAITSFSGFAGSGAVTHPQAEVNATSTVKRAATRRRLLEAVPAVSVRVRHRGDLRSIATPFIRTPYLKRLAYANVATHVA
jgi:hypothetical protein